MLPVANIMIFDKGDILLRKGEVPRYAYKVIKGCLRSYVTDKSGKEHILQFAPEEWLISDMDGFMNAQPATIFIDAIEKSEVMLFRRQLMDEGIGNASREELIERQFVMTKNIIMFHKRVTMLLVSTAEERYLDFIKTYPILFKRLPLKFIASFLGIAPEYLSDIRGKIARR